MRAVVRGWVLCAAVAVSSITGCASSLLPKPAALPTLFALGDASVPDRAARPPGSGPTLIVSLPRAAAGFGTTRIAYVRHPNELEYFAFNEWVDTPAEMLSLLLVRAIDRPAAFAAVLRAPTSASGELRLDTELIRLQQDFTTAPSAVRLTLRAVLIETATHRVVASRTFDARVPAASDDPRGGVEAANAAVSRVLSEVADFCVEQAGTPRPSRSGGGPPR